MFVNKASNPKYSEPNILMNTVLVMNANIKIMNCETTAKPEFSNELIVLIMLPYHQYKLI